MHPRRGIALVVAYVAVSTGGLVGQVPGLPVRNAGIGTGIGIAADAGFPSASAGKGLALAATATIGLGPLGFSGSVARWDPSGTGAAASSAGATANLKVFGGPLIPVSVTLQAGAAYSKQSSNSIEGDAIGIKTWHAPVGLGLALTIPNPVFSIKPWVAPRLDVSRITQSDGGTATSVSITDTNFGISAGVDLGFLIGLTIRAMYDRVSVGDGVNPSVISFGLGFKVGT
jgi:hypothetical protein